MSRKKKHAGEAEHDSVCDLVQCEAEKRGFKTLDHLDYKTFYACGELDVVAYKPGYNTVIVIEVKYNDNYKNRKKAEQQTKRASKFCPFLQQFHKVIRMYAYHDGNGYQLHKL